MTALLEDPMPIILFGIIAEAVLGVVLLRTGRGVVLWAMIGVLLLVAAGVGVEWLVMTDAEQVEAVVEGVAAAVAANDRDRVKKYLDPSAKGLRSRVDWEFDRVDFAEARVTNLEITVDDTASPPTAEAAVIGIISIESSSEGLLRNNYVIDLVAYLHRTPEGWLIVRHKWNRDPRR